MRFFVRPGTFINQLQWSTHHWLILFLFFAIASIESHVGRSQLYYQIYAGLVAKKFGLNWAQSIWVVTFIKLVVMLVGTFALASLIWLVGNLFGRRTSRRVLFRRLAIVFTVFLAGYTSQHLAIESGFLPFITIGLYLWGAILGYFALREQFALNHLEAIVMGLFALLLVSTTWHYSNHIMRDYARSQVAYLHK